MNIDQRHEKVPPRWVNSQWGRIYPEPRKLLPCKIIFSASLALMKWGDKGVLAGPWVWDGARTAPAHGCTPSIAKFHLPFSRTKLLI